MQIRFAPSNYRRNRNHLKYLDQNILRRTRYKQMTMAMRLPIAVRGALMPDAHHGYGLPIGAVLATHNAVIPFGVGMDIGCRMALSILDVRGSFIEQQSYQLKKALSDHTHFGNDGGLEGKQEHEILDHPDFRLTPLLSRL